MATAYQSIRNLAQNRMMVLGVVIALLAGPILSAVLVQGWGLMELSEARLHHLKFWTQVFVAFAITAAAFTNGMGSAEEYWKVSKWKLVDLLVIALILRGVGVVATALMLGYDREVAQMMGAGLTATDPAAIGIALALIKRPKSAILLLAIWLYEIESVANDGLSAIADEGFSGAAAMDIFWLLYWTIMIGVGLVFVGEGARWVIRHDRVQNQLQSRYTDRKKQYKKEAQLEQLFTFIILIPAMHFAYQLHASPIGVVAIGMVVGNAIYHHRKESRYEEEEDIEVDEIRSHYHEIWNVIGLSLFLTYAIVLMPFRALIEEPVHLRNGAVILLSIAVMRVVYEAYFLLRSPSARREPMWWGHSLMSVLLAVALLGVPTSTSAGMFAEGHVDASLDMFAAVLLSWFSVPVSVVFIGWLSKRLDALSSEALQEEETVRHREYQMTPS